MTDAEMVLWSQLRRRKLGGYKFRRQHPIGPFVADFACLDPMLIVELDGEHHSRRSETDAERDTYIAARGFRVLRIWNRDVHRNLGNVLDQILYEIEERDTGKQ